jgi:hypothetical protein
MKTSIGFVQLAIAVKNLFLKLELQTTQKLLLESSKTTTTNCLFWAIMRIVGTNQQLGVK